MSYTTERTSFISAGEGHGPFGVDVRPTHSKIKSLHSGFLTAIYFEGEFLSASYYLFENQLLWVIQ